MNNILLLDAPSGAGKTRYIHTLGATPENTLTSEQLMETIVQMARTHADVAKTAQTLSHIRFFENMESLAGRQETQKIAAQLVNTMAKQRPIILTGINFRKKLPHFLNALDDHLIKEGSYDLCNF